MDGVLNDRAGPHRLSGPKLTDGAQSGPKLPAVNQSPKVGECVWVKTYSDRASSKGRFPDPRNRATLGHLWGPEPAYSEVAFLRKCDLVVNPEDLGFGGRIDVLSRAKPLHAL